MGGMSGFICYAYCLWYEGCFLISRQVCGPITATTVVSPPLVEPNDLTWFDLM